MQYKNESLDAGYLGPTPRGTHAIVDIFVLVLANTTQITRLAAASLFGEDFKRAAVIILTLLRLMAIVLHI